MSRGLWGVRTAVVGGEGSVDGGQRVVDGTGCWRLVGRAMVIVLRLVVVSALALPLPRGIRGSCYFFSPLP